MTEISVYNLQKNGGVFIKVGQHIGALDYLLPEEYVNTMKVESLRIHNNQFMSLHP